MKHMDEILASIHQIPPFPQVAIKAMDIISNTQYVVSDLVEVIRLDQSITANILKLCNSAYFGLPRKVSSLKEAVVYLGTIQLRQVLLASGAKDIYDRPDKGYSYFVGELWQHAIACALMSQVLARHLRLPLDENSIFTAALLHDVGKVVLSTYVSQEFAEIEMMVKEEHLSFHDAERQALGFDHAEIGGRLAELWKFPDSIVAAIRFHHEPEKSPKTFRLLSELIALSDGLVLMVGYGTSADGLSYHIPHLLVDKLKLKKNDIEVLMIKFQEEMDKAQEMIDVKDVL
ncbi:MAG: HDOD domain-containing protein [Deltaproteobacteria bacterium]|nr:HDOD domain-containing protein [Candidatus Tharpellaceae bacterium]